MAIPLSPIISLFHAFAPQRKCLSDFILAAAFRVELLPFVNVSKNNRACHLKSGLAALQPEEPLMCDYSLHAIASRPAKVGETLISTNFRGSATLGFASPAEPDVAVCLLPGTELAFEEDVRCQ